MPSGIRRANKLPFRLARVKPPLLQSIAGAPSFVESAAEMFVKKELLEVIHAEMRVRLDRLVKAARAAHDAATDPDSKAESRYDTRSLEESYLAAGQARQVDELAETIKKLDGWQPENFKRGAAVAPGAFVEIKNPTSGDVFYFLLAPAYGGLEVDWDGKEVTLLSPESPLHEKLLGMKVGEVIESPPFLVKAIR